MTVNCEGNLAFHIDNQDVDVHKMDSHGALTPVPGFPFLTSGGFNAGLALSPNNRFLLVTDRFGPNFSSNISAFRGGRSGNLSPVPGSPFPAAFGPGIGATTTSNDGNYFYSAMVAFSQVDVQMIGANGALTDVESFATGLPGAGSGASGSLRSRRLPVSNNDLATHAARYGLTRVVFSPAGLVRCNLGQITQSAVNFQLIYIAIPECHDRRGPSKLGLIVR